MKKIFIILLILVSIIFLIVACIKPEAISAPMPSFPGSPDNMISFLPTKSPSPITIFTPQPITTTAPYFTPIINSSTSPIPQSGKEIKFETIKRAMGRPNWSLGLYYSGVQNNQPPSLKNRPPFL